MTSYVTYLLPSSLTMVVFFVVTVFPFLKLNQNYTVLVVVDTDLLNCGCESKSVSLKPAPNEDDRNPNEPLFELPKNPSSSNNDLALNKPPPNPLPMLLEKNGSLSNILPNPRLPKPEEEPFFSFFLPKKFWKNSSSNGFSSKKCLKISSASWKLN